MSAATKRTKQPADDARSLLGIGDVSLALAWLVCVFAWRAVAAGGGVGGSGIAIDDSGVQLMSLLLFSASGLITLRGAVIVGEEVRELREGKKRSLSTASVSRFYRHFRREDSGVVATALVLVLPIYLGAIAVLVQLSLLASAGLVVNHAAFASARALKVHFTTDEIQPIHQSATLVLQSISPRSPQVTGRDQRIAQQLASTRTIDPVGDRVSARHAYARVATMVTIDPPASGVRRMFLSVSPPAPRRLTLSYDFMLTVPIAARVLSPDVQTIAGVRGRFFRMRASSDTMTAPGEDFVWEAGTMVEFAELLGGLGQ
ncbi:MAG: hypothetical protein AAGF84_00280 [Planctomycetota bacterium]